MRVALAAARCRAGAERSDRDDQRHALDSDPAAGPDHSYHADEQHRLRPLVQQVHAQSSAAATASDALTHLAPLSYGGHAGIEPAWPPSFPTPNRTARSAGHPPAPLV